MIKIEKIDSDQFLDLLIKWDGVGRSLITLPKFVKRDMVINIKVIGLDNTTVHILDKSFSNYSDALGWYGAMVDSVYG